MEFYSEHYDDVYGSGDIYSSLKFPNCFIIKTVRRLASPAQMHLFAEV